MERTGRRALEDSGHSPAHERPAPAAPGMLGLGNQALAALIARDATKEKPPISGPRVVFPDIGAIPIESMQWAGGGRPGGGGRDESRPSEITFTSKTGDHSADLMREMLQGQPKDVEVFHGGMKIKLKGAMVSSYQTSGGGEEPLESWTLNFQGIEFEGEKKQGDAGTPDQDRSYPG